VRAAQCGSARTVRPGAKSAAAAAGQAAGSVQASARQGRCREPNPCGAQQLLGAEPPDRRACGRAAIHGARRGLVRAAAGTDHAAAAWPGQALHQLPACHRLAGAQAGGLRPVPLPAGAVPHESVPHGLRRVGGSRRGRGRACLLAAVAVGGPGDRGGRGRGPALAVGPGPARDGGRGGKLVASARARAGHRRYRGNDGSASLRRVIIPGGGKP
jgi:hypothetical protein